MDVITLPPVASDAAPTPEILLSEQFLDFLRLEKSASACTIKSYRSDLRHFGQFLSGVIGSWTFDRIPTAGDLNEKFLACTPLMAGEFRSYLFAQNYGQASIARKLSVLKGMYRFLLHRGIISASPFSAIQAPKWAKRNPKYISQDQIRKLLDAPGHASLLAVRDSAILELLYSSGIRVSEMVELKMTDVDLAAGTVHIRGLSPVERMAAINPQAIAALELYLPRRSSQGMPRAELVDRVFLNKDGNPLSTRSVRRKLERYLAVAGLSPALSPSTIRNSLAVHLVEQGVEIKDLQKILGYQNFNSARKYARLAARTLAENQVQPTIGTVTSRTQTAA